MKHFKQLLVVCLATVAVVMSSCMKDGENIATAVIPMKVEPYSMPQTFIDGSGIKIIPDRTYFDLMGKFYYGYFQYDPASISAGTKQLQATFLADPVCIDGGFVEVKKVEPDAAFYALTDGVLPPAFFDKENLVIPFTYWVKKESSKEAQDIELAKHIFVLSYNEEEFIEGNTTLNFYLGEKLDENEDNASVSRLNYTSDCKVYDISYALSDFEDKTGKEPSTVVINYKLNMKSNSVQEAEDKRIELDYTYFRK